MQPRPQTYATTLLTLISTGKSASTRVLSHWSQTPFTMYEQLVLDLEQILKGVFVVDRPDCIHCSIHHVQGASATVKSRVGADVEPQVSERDTAPRDLPFGWQRATLLGAFFNGVFLLGLGVSIFLQSIERFVGIERS